MKREDLILVGEEEWGEEAQGYCNTLPLRLYFSYCNELWTVLRCASSQCCSSTMKGVG